jgi:hypothetical protein
MTTLTHEKISFPNFTPEQFTVHQYNEPIYDPFVHLDLQKPDFIINLKFDKFYFEKFNPDCQNDRDRLNEFLKPGFALFLIIYF